jgi:hypothetical protein
VGKVEDAKSLDDVFAIARSRKGYLRHIDDCCAEDVLKSVLIAFKRAPDVYWETKDTGYWVVKQGHRCWRRSSM